MANFYSCSATDPTSLVTAGASAITISYQYEVDTSSSLASLEEAMERVQAAMLKSVAQQSGVVDCPASDADAWRRLGVPGGNAAGEDELEGSSEGMVSAGHLNHRQLRAGGRGSNSIVGLSSLPVDTVMDVLCHADALELATTRLDNDPFNSTEREVTPGMVGGFVVDDESGKGEGGNAGDENEGGDAGEVVDNDTDPILSSTRIDGKTLSRSVSNNNNNSQAGNSNANESGNSNDGIAFNYISTESEPLSRSSHTSHNPLVAPAIFQQRSQIKSRPSPNLNSNSNGDTQFKVPSSSEGKEARTINDKCTVIQGHISVYTFEGSTFENLEDRLLAALTAEVNTNMDKFTNDLVLSVRMHEQPEIAVVDPIPSRPGYMPAIKGGVSTQQNSANSGSGFAFSTSMAVLLALGCLFIGLAALFVHTSSPQPKKRRKLNNEKEVTRQIKEASVGTFDDADVEMDFKQVERVKTFDDDDFSIGEFSVSSAKESMYSPRGGILNALSFGSPSRKSRDTRNAPAATAPRRNANLAPPPTAHPSPIKSSMLGLFTARPRATSSDGEMELDVQSVYDCDTEYTPARSVRGRAPTPAVNPATPGTRAAAAAARAAQRNSTPVDLDDDSAYAGDGTGNNITGGITGDSSQHTPTLQSVKEIEEGIGATLASYIGLWSTPRTPAVSPDGNEVELDLRRVNSDANYRPIDNDDLVNDGIDCGVEDAGCTKSSLLRFFSAREGCASPHSEVEASLAPFNDVSEYREEKALRNKRKDPPGAREVESNYFIGNAATNKADRIILNPTFDENEEHDPQAVGRKEGLGNKFRGFLRRGSRAPSMDEAGVIDIQEIHEIYSNDDDTMVSRKPSPTPTDIYTMQRKPSSLLKRPLDFYKSPSTLNARSKSESSQANTPARTTNKNEESSPSKSVARTEASDEDDNQSEIVAVNGVMCLGVTDCLRPDAGWFGF